MNRQAYIISIKPLSVNQAWQGRRFKTPAYKAYDAELYLKLPSIDVPKGKLALTLDIGYSNKSADLDNAAKPILDILQRRYGFNDSRIYRLEMNKHITAKGAEFIGFNLRAA